MSREVLYAYAAGVIKFDQFCAGYPDLIQVTSQWAKDPNFHSIMIRHVSDDNLGISFIHLIKLEGEVNFNFFKTYIETLYQKFGKGEGGIYAIDIDHKTVTLERLKNVMPVLKGISETIQKAK